MGMLLRTLTRLGLTYYITAERPPPVWRTVEASGRRDTSEIRERYVLKPLRITLNYVMLRCFTVYHLIDDVHRATASTAIGRGY